MSNPKSKKPLKHLIPHYVLMGLLFFTGALAIVVLEDGVFKWVVLAGLCGLYVIWGIWHHYEERTLTQQVAWEYLGIAVLLGTILVLASS